MRDEGQSRVEISHANAVKVKQLQGALEGMLGKILRPGFYGQASVGVVVQDGVIQRITTKIERVEK